MGAGNVERGTEIRNHILLTVVRCLLTVDLGRKVKQSNIILKSKKSRNQRWLRDFLLYVMLLSCQEFLFALSR